MDIKGVFQSIGTGLQNLGSFFKSSFAKLFSRSSYKGTNESSTPLDGRVTKDMQSPAASLTNKAAMRILKKAEDSLKELRKNLPQQLSANLLASPELQDSELMQDIEKLAKDIKKTKVAITADTKTTAISGAKVEISQIKTPHILQNNSLISRYNQLASEIAEKAQGISKEQATELLNKVNTFIKSIGESIKELEKAQNEGQKGVRTSEKFAASAYSEAKKYARENNPDLFKLAVKTYVRAKAFSKKNSETVRQSTNLITQFKKKKIELEKVAKILKKLSEAPIDFSVRLTQ